MAAGSAPEPWEHRITTVDAIMIAMALVSLGLLVYEEVYHPSPQVLQRIILIDLAIVGVFAIEFVWRLAQAQDRKAYVKGHWYDLIGMVPVSHPMFRAFRLARILRILVLTGRAVRATNRSFGEAATERLLGKYRDIVVETLSDAIILRLLDQTQEVLARGNYGSAAARALDANRDALLAKVNEQIRRERAGRLILATPGVERMVEAVQERTLKAAITTLGSEEMNRTILAVLEEVIHDLRRGVARREWRAPTPVPV